MMMGIKPKKTIKNIDSDEEMETPRKPDSPKDAAQSMWGNIGKFQSQKLMFEAPLPNKPVKRPARNFDEEEKSIPIHADLKTQYAVRLQNLKNAA